MKRWIPLVALVLLLIALALSASRWLPPLLAFVGANTDLIQGLQAGTQIVLWLGAAGVALFIYLRGRRKPAAQEQEGASAAATTSVRQEMSGPGAQAGRDLDVGQDWFSVTRSIDRSAPGARLTSRAISLSSGRRLPSVSCRACGRSFPRRRCARLRRTISRRCSIGTCT